MPYRSPRDYMNSGFSNYGSANNNTQYTMPSTFPQVNVPPSAPPSSIQNMNMQQGAGNPMYMMQNLQGPAPSTGGIMDTDFSLGSLTDKAKGAAYAMPSTGSGNNADWFSSESMFGKNGWVTPGVQLGSALMGSYLGYKQLKEAKRTRQQANDQFNKNYNAQKKTINAQTEARHRLRIAEGRTDESLDSYMQRYGVE